MNHRYLLCFILAGSLLGGCDRRADESQAPPAAAPPPPVAVAQPAPPPPPVPAGCTTGRRTVERNSPGLQCLERKTGTGKVDVPVPIQNDRSAYDTDCPVKLQPIGHGGHCTKKPVLLGKSIEVTYDSPNDKFFFTLKQGAQILLDKVEATAHGSGSTIGYLSYVDSTAQLEYFIYLVDLDASTQQHEKYYMVEAFDLNDTSNACVMERPEQALKPKERCDEPAFMPFVQGEPGTDVYMLQIDTGGGYEPPP